MGVLKLCGGLLIVLAAGWTGVMPAVRLRRRLRILEELEGSMHLMRAELTSNLTPLPELCKKLALASAGPVSGLYDTLCDGLRSQPLATPLHLMRTALPALALEPREAAILLELANALGCYDLESQQRMVDAAQVRLYQAAEYCRKRLAGESRGWGVMGLCTGLALAIVLI